MKECPACNSPSSQIPTNETRWLHRVWICTKCHSKRMRVDNEGVMDIVARRCLSCGQSGMEPGEGLSFGLREFVCAKCGGRHAWVADPAMDGSANEKHKPKGEVGYSCSSMLSDPDCEVFMKKNKVWVVHHESMCIAPIEREYMDCLSVELCDCVAGTREEIFRYLISIGWKSDKISQYEIHVEDVYMVGVPDGKGGYDVLAGTTTNIDDILNDRPPSEFQGMVVIAFNQDHVLLFRWHWGRGEWVGLKK